jgi:WD40 repeat protein
LILDNGETILQSGQFAGMYRADDEAYGELLRQIGELSHQSCVVLTSREKPETIANLEGDKLPVRSLVLSELANDDTDRLFDAIGLSPSQKGRQRLTEVYSGNPLALKIVATSIRELFDDDIDAFVNEETTVFNGIRRLLDRQYQRLTPIEQQVMTWLAIERDWLTISQLHAQIVPPATKQRLMETLESLSRRSLIEQKQGRFTQQPVVMEYLTERLIERICVEIQTATTPIETERAWAFNSYALIQATAKDYVRESQIRLILKPIADGICQQFGSAALAQQMLQILSIVRTADLASASYGAGNLINLANYLKLDLTGCDFSDLTIRQAYLQNTSLNQVNLARAHLIACRFAEPFSQPTSLAVTSDGDTMAIGHEDGTIQIWQVSTGHTLLAIQAHSSFIFGLTFSPDDRTLVSSSLDSSVKFWDVSTGECQRIWAFDQPWGLACSPDGKILAGGLTDKDRSIYLWDWQTGRCLNTLVGHLGPATALAFAPQPIPSHDGCDRQLLVSAGQDGLIKIWDVDSGNCLQTLTEQVGIIFALSFHPDGDCFATGSYDHSLKIWDLTTGSCIQTLLGHTAQVASVSFSPDGRLLASASNDRSIRLWDVATGKCIHILQGHVDSIWSIAFAAGVDRHGELTPGRVLVSVGLDRTARFWDVSSHIADSTADNVRTIPNSRHLESISGHCLKTIQGDGYGIRSVACHPDGHLIASGGVDGAIRLWDVATGKCIHTFTGHTAGIWKVAFHPDGNLIASGSLNGEIRIWELDTNRCSHSLLKRNTWILGFVFSSHGDLLSSGNADALRCWDVQTGECWRSIPQEPDAYLIALDVHPQGDYFISVGNDNQIRWWDLKSGECFRHRSGRDGQLWDIAFHPAGHLFATIGGSAAVKLWDADAGECLGIWEGHTGTHGSIAFSPDGAMLASGRGDRTIRLWDVSTGKCLHVLAGHTSGVTSVCFLPIGSSPQTILVSSSHDETIRLWDANTGACLKLFRPERLYEGMDISDVTGLTA